MLAIRNPKIQTKLVHYATTRLSEQYGTAINVGSVDINFFTQIRIQDIYVEDLQKDTLFYTGNLYTEALAFAPFKNKFALNATRLQDVKVHIHTPENDSLSNLQQLLANANTKPTTPSTSKKKKRNSLKPKLKLSFKGVNLDHLDLTILNDYQKSYTTVQIEHLSTYFKNFNLPKKIIEAKVLELDRPKILLNTEHKKRSGGHEEDSTTFTLPDGWTFSFDELHLKDGIFSNKSSPKPEKSKDVFAFNNFYWTGFNLHAKDIYGKDNQLDFIFTDVQFLDETGLRVKQLLTQGIFSSKEIVLHQLDLEMEESYLKANMVLNYKKFKNFSDFVNSVPIHSQIQELKLAPREFKILFGSSPVQEPVYVSGSVDGSVSDLVTEDLTIRFENGTLLKGDVSTIGLPDLENTFFEARITDLKTSQYGIQQITGKKELPEQIAKLGNIDFKGEFLGYISEFVGYGTIQTELGSIDTDIKFSSKDPQNPSYSGYLDTPDFDLGYWLGQPDLGRINFSGNVQGKRFDLATMDATFDINIQSIDYDQLNIQNIDAKGSVKNQILDANIQLDDPRLLGEIDGSLNYSDQLVGIDFNSKIQKADLFALKLMNYPFEVSGLFNAQLEGSDSKHLLGAIQSPEVQIETNNKDYDLKNLSVTLDNKDGEGILSLYSEHAKVQFSGRYNYSQLIPTLKRTINHYYLVDKSWDNTTDVLTQNDLIGFEVEIDKNDQLSKIFIPDLDIGTELTLDGQINPKTYEISFVANTDSLNYKQYNIKNWTIDAIGDGNIFVVNSFQDQIENGNKAFLKSSEITIEMSRNEILADLRTYSSGNFLSAKLSSRIKRVDDLFEISILSSDLVLAGDRWVIDPDNELIVGKDKWFAKDFTLSNQDQHITIETPKGNTNTKLELVLENIEVDGINRMFAFSKNPVGGLIDGQVNLIDMGQGLDVDLSVNINDFMFNEDEIDAISIDALYDIQGQLADFDGVVNDNDYQMYLKGDLDLKNKQETFRAFLDIQRSSLDPFQSLWDNSISDLEGSVDGEIDIVGNVNGVKMGGFVNIIEDLYVTLDFSQVRYYIPKGQSVNIQKDGFVISDLRVYDPYKQEATINGKIYHNNFNNFSLNLAGEYENFLLVDTKERDNNSFWGTALASGSLRFSGPVNNAVMTVVAQSQPGTEIFIGNSGASNIGSYNFIRFKEPIVDSTNQNNAIEPNSKLTMHFNLNVLPNAWVNMRFDPEGLNSLRGAGYGNLRINMDTEDMLEIIGTFEVSQGVYKVDYKGIFEKSFEIQPGGIIQWSGNPFDAKLDINAVYTLDADLRPISSQASSSGKYLADAETQINVHLGETLSRPDFSYQIIVEKAQAGTDVAEQLDYINSNKSILDQQIAYLLLLDQFAPINSSPFQNNDVGGIAINSVTNILTRQVNQLLNESGILKNTQIGIDYKDYSQSNYQVGSNFGYDKNLQLQIQQSFLNDRVELEVGSDFNFGDHLSNNINTFQVGDIILTYKLDESGNIRLLLFSKRDFSILQGAEQRRNGFGIVIQREFNSFKELFQKKKDNQPPTQNKPDSNEEGNLPRREFLFVKENEIVEPQ